MTTQLFYRIMKFGTLVTAVLLPFVVVPWVLYPFIFGKTLFLYAMMLLLVIPFTILMIYDSAYRSRVMQILKEPIFLAIALVFIIDVIASIVGVDRDRSIWGDEERGMGLVTELFLLMWYVMMRSTVTTREEVKHAVRWIVISGVGVAILALLRYVDVKLFGVDTGFRVSGTIANPIFFAGIMVLYATCAAYLAHESMHMRSKVLWWGCAALMICMIVLTKTRGTLAGVVVSVIVFGVFAGLLHKGRIRRYALIGVTSLIIGVVGFVYAGPYLNHIPALQRFTSFSLKDSSVRTRVAAWQSGMSAFKERPLLGWGVENFAIAFDYHYNPSLLHAGYTETRFDRAHNIIVEKLTTVGVIGLVAYMLFIGALWYYSVRMARHDWMLGSLFFAGITAYLVHLMLAFDTSVSLLLLYSICAIVSVYVHGDSSSSSPVRLPSWACISLVGSSALAVVALYYLVIVPMQANSALLHAIVIASDKSNTEALPQFELATRFPTVYPEESRDEYVRNAARILFSRTLSREDAVALLERADSFAEDNIGEHPRFSHYHFIRGMLYKNASYLDESYKDKALRYFDDARAASPKRQQYHFAKAEVYNERRDFESALKEYNAALSDAPEIYLSQWYKAVTLLALSRKEEAHAILIPFAERQKAPPSREEQEFLVRVLDSAGRTDLMVYYIMNFVEHNLFDASEWARLAALFKEVNEFNNAYFAAQMSARLDSTFKEEAGVFLATLPSEAKNTLPSRKKLLEYEQLILRERPGI